MKVLILHPNFPGQFKHVAKFLAEADNDVRFICQTHYNREIKNICRICIKGRLGDQQLRKDAKTAIERSRKMAFQYEEAMELLKESWNPDVVISHSGWGCGTYVKKVWPECKHIAYVEWWFDPNSSLFYYDTKNKDLGITEKSLSRQWIRNSQQALELSCADKLISPTKWQREQLPNIFKEYCEVIYDGI